jgi:hypothetical protein
MKRTVVELPNGIRIIINKNSNPQILMLFQKAFDKLNREFKYKN